MPESVYEGGIISGQAPIPVVATAAPVKKTVLFSIGNAFFRIVDEIKRF